MKDLVFIEVAEICVEPLTEIVARRAPCKTNARLHTPTHTLTNSHPYQVNARSGWTPQMGWLVDKRPPRQCLTTKLPVQIFDPVIYLNKNWKRRAFACLNKKGCRDGLVDDGEDRKWKKVKSFDATFIFLDDDSLRKLPKDVFRKIYFEREGSTYLDVVLGGPALNGDLFQQFEARQAYAKGMGCVMNDLSVQLPTYRAHVLEECLEIRQHATKTSRLSLTWISQANVQQSMSSPALLQKLGDCKSVEPALIVETMTKPLLFEKSKFTVRAFLLVGSTMPFMVFFRRGYIRVHREGASFPKDTSLEDFQRFLANNKITGTHFVDTFLKSSLKRIALLLFQASRTTMERRRGSYQLYALDFVVDDQLRVYLEKSDPCPDLISLQNSASDSSTMIAEMHDLVMELHEEPTAFETMITGDKYGLFELIFSELRETCEGTLYNPCHSFYDYNSKPLAKANKKISTSHNAFNREHHEETRVRKKLEEDKKAKCKEQKLSLESKACDKLWTQLEADEFERLFAEHEKDWNPNAFKMARPGEVFPWEMV